uniref:B3 domain-containing protein Os04g0386900-like n=1 Tax=Erigeron canadensis TaxID=72917 RepID=UPI001CB973D7|nr:B3 domain-containing protein Os04g0386900-like [Erigeron canadensis]XP_043622596.1 B3 domain-containing protein Os04g0386900-like [Erigeron canadensis]
MDFQAQKQSAKTGGGETSYQPNCEEEEEAAEYWPLSGSKPYFIVVLPNSNPLKPFQVRIPREVSDKIPTTTVLAKIVYQGKEWDLPYLPDRDKKKFATQAWGKFVRDMDLKVGDACVFELMEIISKGAVVKFRVQILRDNFPSELVEKAEGSESNPIEVL